MADRSSAVMRVITSAVCFKRRTEKYIINFIDSCTTFGVISTVKTVRVRATFSSRRNEIQINTIARMPMMIIPNVPVQTWILTASTRTRIQTTLKQPQNFSEQLRDNDFKHSRHQNHNRGATSTKKTTNSGIYKYSPDPNTNRKSQLHERFHVNSGGISAAEWKMAARDSLFRASRD